MDTIISYPIHLAGVASQAALDALDARVTALEISRPEPSGMTITIEGNKK
ncbi:hypothetical protein OS965_42150 [Streptomyces sp. H27-G5]|nr:hypothetical protein [Streptomyces sp. H27-G5]MCY0924592.1 hypothetical protein [Streptomyces sp. H27-G5]